MAQANSSCWPQLPPGMESLQLAEPLPSPPIPPTQHSCPNLDTQSSKKATSTSVFIKRPLVTLLQPEPGSRVPMLGAGAQLHPGPASQCSGQLSTNGCRHKRHHDYEAAQE